MDSAAAREATWMGDRPVDDGREIVERIANGDRDALTDLYARYESTLSRYLYQVTTDRGLAEEVLQDTLVAVWKGAAHFEGRSTVQTWLIGIARRQAHNCLRRRSLPWADASELEIVPAPGPDPEDLALANAEKAELAILLKRLAPVHREALVLTFIDGLSYQEIATVLGIPQGTVKSRLSNAKRALRALLQASEEVER